MKPAGLARIWAVSLIFGANIGFAAKQSEPATPLTPSGEELQARYAAVFTALKAEITKALPAVSGQKKTALQQAREAVKKAAAGAQTAQATLDKVRAAQGLVEHAKGKWIGGAQKGIAHAEMALEKATTDAERDAAKKDLAHWQADLKAGQKALKERQAALDKAKLEEPQAIRANQAAQAELTRARADELAAAKALLAETEAFLSSAKLDGKLAKAAVLAHATPRGLAEFAQQKPEQTALVEKLLNDETLMKDMLVAGGAEYGRYGQAMEIFTAIQKASPKAADGVLRRLALATSLEHAAPIAQSNAENQINSPSTVDPLKRYLHYEKAYLDGELDPVFKNLSAWEMRMVVDSDAPDEILAWGREMLRTYRPDHIANPDYGWRYVSIVKTDVQYGSQDVKNDRPDLHHYQNIPLNGGVCGRRAFFGRFILKSLGIPTWGVTQHKHAALSHWTPKGWVVNLGAGFNASWWDKDDVPRNGTEFLLEAQARERGDDYWRVLRAQWVSRVLGEPARNERKKVEGGFWSNLGHYQAAILASQAVQLGPLGQELGEANTPESELIGDLAPCVAADQKVAFDQNGTIVIPAAAHGKTTGKAAAMKSFGGGMQIIAGGGFKTEYVFDVPQAGKYALTARVATLQQGQKFLIAANGAPESVELAVPYTIGLWQLTQPVEIALSEGANILHFAIQDGSRTVAIKNFSLIPVKSQR